MRVRAASDSAHAHARAARRRRLGLCCGALLLASACAREHSASDSRTQPAHSEAGSGGVVDRANAGASKDSDRGHPGAQALATLEPVLSAGDEERELVSGTAVFVESEAGVDLAIKTRGCGVSDEYPVFIQAGADCSTDTLLGAHWDGRRGENISAVTCNGTSGTGRSFYTRPKSDAKPWTVGSPAGSNLLGHALVLCDAEMQPLACGPIVRTDDVPNATPPPDKRGSPPGAVPVEQKAQIAGICLARQIVRDNAQECPDPSSLAKCASEHCQLEACLPICAEYLACTAGDSDPCASTCAVDQACADCQQKIVQCTLGFCVNEIACAAPVAPGGPCAQLEACCAMQGDKADACLEMVHLLEKISGDPSCFGAMHDWDTTAHLSLPCKFQ